MSPGTPGMRLRCGLSALGVVLAAGTAPAQISLYVDDSAPPGGDGLAWGSALTSLQDALTLVAASAGQVTEIRLGQGSYRPDRGILQTPGDRAASFVLLDDLAIRGGYAGYGAPNPDLRNTAAYPSVLSGDLAGDDGPGFANRADNSNHVVVSSGNTESAVLDGVVVSGGSAYASPADNSGGGLLIAASSPTVTACVFTDNDAGSNGGGLAVTGSTTSVAGCVFLGNRAYQGGGLSAEGSDIRVLGCTFQGNAAQIGAGLWPYQTTATINACAFTANLRRPGESSVGGAIVAGIADLTVTASTFVQNQGVGVGASGARALVDGCTFRGNTGGGVGMSATKSVVLRSLFAGNSGVSGAGVSMSPSSPGDRSLYAGGSGFLNKWNGVAWTPAATTVVSGGAVRALSVFDDGSGAAIYAGGSFVDAGTVPATTGIARLDAGGYSSVGGGMNGDVNALAAFTDARGPALYAAGSFTTAGGVTANAVARWDGSAWSPLGTGLDGTARALAVFDDGSGPALYVGGVFGLAGSTPASRIARWSGSSWSSVAAGVNGDVNALAAGSPGGTPGLFAGGEFSASGPTPAQRIARWNGSQWSALGGGVDGSPILAMTAWDNGTRLYIGGGFATVNNGAVVAGGMARWDGSAWASLGSGLSAGARAMTLFTPPGQPEVLCVGGDFVSAGGVAANHVARWNGLAWSAVGAGQPDPVLALTGYDNHVRLIRGCRFFGNSAGGGEGGAVYGADVIADCVFSGNSAQDGGAIYCGDAAISNCTLVANTALGWGGGVRATLMGTNTPRLSNCVVYFNSDGFGTGQASQVSNSSGTVILNSCCLQNLTGSWGGVGNISSNPLFVNRAGPDNITGTEDDDLHPLVGSPLIDRGNVAFLALPLAADADGNARFVDGDHNGSALIDIGAYEYQVPPCYANCDGSTTPPVLNLIDFACFLNRFAAADSYANCDHSTSPPVLNVIDFACFLNAYAQGCP